MKKGNQIRINTDQSLLSGIKKHLGKGGTLVIDEEKYSHTEIINLLQSRIDAVANVTTTRSAWQRSVREERQKNAETKKTVAAIRQTILVMYASKNDVLSDFGLLPRRERRSLTAAEQLETTEKAKATRAARHTMGKRQKQAIKGDANDAPPAVAPPPAPVQPVAVDTPTMTVPAKMNGSPSPVAAGGS